jgi:hypothetical protein
MKVVRSENVLIFGYVCKLVEDACRNLLTAAAFVDDLDKSEAIDEPAGLEELHGRALALCTDLAKMFAQCYAAQAIKDRMNVVKDAGISDRTTQDRTIPINPDRPA